MVFLHDEQYINRVTNQFMTLFSSAAILGTIFVAVTLLIAKMPIGIVAISVGSSAVFALIVIKMKTRSIKKRYSNSEVKLDVSGLSMTYNQKTLRLETNQIQKVEVLRNARKELIRIRFLSDPQIDITRIISNINGLLMELKLHFPGLVIEEKNSSRAKTILTWFLSFSVLLVIYLFRFITQSAIIRAILDGAIPFIAGVYLLLLRPSKNPYFSKGKKTILAVFLLVISLGFVMMGILDGFSVL